jgi:hypothetical protein
MITIGLVTTLVAAVRTRVVQKRDPRPFNYLMIFLEILSDHVGRASFGSPVENVKLREYARGARAAWVMAVFLILGGLVWLFLIQPTTWVE